MAVTSGSQNALLPLPGHLPAKTRCIQIDVPDDPDFFRMFYGSLDVLTDWFAYDRDAAHTGRLVAALWRKAIRSIRECGSEPANMGGCCDDCGCGGCMQFRQQDCLLQVFDCLTQTWVTVYDGSKCLPNVNPGGGTINPPPGGSADVCMTVDSGALTQIPWLVNSGDTLNFTKVEGAATDGSGAWFCPDGSVYFAGACVSTGHLQSGDPDPTVYHMHLLLKLGSNFYPLVGGVFTVPAGISNGAIYIQPNTANLANDRGQYNVCITYTNNQAVTGSWHAHINFAATPGPFAALPNLPGVWTPGVGWTTAWDNVNLETGMYPNTALAACTLTKVAFHINTYQVGAIANFTSTQAAIATQVHQADDPFSAGISPPELWIWDGVVGHAHNFPSPQTAVTQLLFILLTSDSHNAASGSAAVDYIDIYGTGPVPSQLQPYIV